jgi:hypothetical protein
MLVKVLGIFATLLPARYRGHWLSDGNFDLRHGAILSACLQFVICGAVLWIRYPAFLAARVAEMAARAGVSDKTASVFIEYAAGVFSVFQYMVNPISLVLVYFMLEGGVRIFASVANDEVLPTLPLQFVAWAHDYASFRYEEKSMGARIADVVQPGEPGKYDLKIASCRPKQWNHLTTIGWNDEFFELDREEQGPPPRRHVYLLKKLPPGKIIRGLHHYQPEEVLQKPGWAPLSSTLTTKDTKEHQGVPS